MGATKQSIDGNGENGLTVERERAERDEDDGAAATDTRGESGECRGKGLGVAARVCDLGFK